MTAVSFTVVLALLSLVALLLAIVLVAVLRATRAGLRDMRHELRSFSSSLTQMAKANQDMLALVCQLTLAREVRDERSE